MAVLPVAGVVLLMAESWRSASEADAAAGVVRLAEAVAVHQENLLTSTALLLEALAHSSEIKDRAACAPFLADLHAQRPEFGVMGVADAQGDFWCSSLPTDEPISVADRDYFVAAAESGSLAVGSYQVGRVTGRPTVALAHPLPSVDGQFAGTVIASVDLSRPAVLAERLDLPEGSRVTVLDREGTVLMQWPHEDGLVDQDASDHLARQRPGTAVRMAGLDAVERVYGATTLHDDAGQLILTVGVPVDHLETAVINGLRDAALQLAAVSALALALAVLVGRRMILRPARRLIETVRQVGSGDLTARTSGVGGGEFAELAGEFDAMTASLQEREVELRAAEHRAVEERYRGLVEIAADAVVVIDDDDRVALLNQGAHRLFGNPEKVWSQQLAPQLGDDLEAEGRTEVCWTDDGGAVRWVDASTSRNSDGRTTVILRDVTARHEAAAALRRAVAERGAANKALEEAAVLKDDFVAIASHELRTPVTVLQGLLHTIDQRWEQLDPDQLRGFVAVLSRSANRLGELVEDLLLVSRLEGRAVSLANAVPVNVQDIVEESVAASRMAGRTIDVEVEPDLVAHADPGHLARALTNILDNAVKYGQAPYQLQAFQGPDSTVQVRVIDHGDGVPEDFAPHMFEKFTRAPETAAEQPGTGLGLAIVGALAEAMGGAVTHGRTASGATCFTVTVPQRPGCAT